MTMTHACTDSHTSIETQCVDSILSLLQGFKDTELTDRGNSLKSISHVLSSIIEVIFTGVYRQLLTGSMMILRCPVGC